jgi:uncharacterized protein
MSLVLSLLRREDRFSSLLTAMAAEVQANVRALDQLLTSPSPAVSLKSFLQARAKEQEIKDEIDTLLCQRYGTPLDHADVEALARALNRIAKGLRKFAERYLICAAHIRDVSFAPQLQLLASVAERLQQMVASLGGRLSVAATKERDQGLQQLDEAADKLFRDNLAGLYQGRHTPMKAIMLKDLHEQLDRVFDRCRATGDLILQIVLKLS